MKVRLSLGKDLFLKAIEIIKNNQLEAELKYLRAQYWMYLQILLQEGQIIFSLENSLPEQIQQTTEYASGIGIENSERRLALLYPDRHRLNIKQNEKTFIVELIINPDTNEN